MWGQAHIVSHSNSIIRIIPMRVGTSSIFYSIASQCGIIPMRVGTRWIAVINQAVNEDHPHACGDKYFFDNFIKLRQGSSPCVWGQVTFKHFPFVNTRIIPMRVGTSSIFYSIASQCGIIPMRVGTRWIAVINQAVNEDHPHACGDKYFFDNFIKLRQGSSPCVWGQVTFKHFPFVNTRIIPMRVGTRALSLNMYPFVRDHPHACGDKLSSACLYAATSGSSPCVWGQDRRPV